MKIFKKSLILLLCLSTLCATGVPLRLSKGVFIMKICGIYKITSPSKCIYIGQSKDIHLRFKQYKSRLAHKQTRLSNSFKKHGFEKHKFEIIFECPESELNEKEKYFIDLFQSFNTKFGMNLRDGGDFCRFISDETRKKLSDNSKGNKYGLGNKHSEEIKKQIGINTRINWTGRKHSEETKAKMSASRTNKKFSDEHKKNISLGQKGRKSVMEGKKHSDATKLKMSMSAKGVPKSDEAKRNMSLAKKGKTPNRWKNKWMNENLF